MAKISVGDQFPAATLKDIDGSTVDIPAVFVTGRKSEWAYVSESASDRPRSI